MDNDKKLFELDKFGEELEGIIIKFGEEGRIFSNEEQFQFELALAIEHKYQKDEEGYPRIRLEVLSYPTSEGKNEEDALDKIADLSAEERKKMYTDIVVDINKTESIAIELKYKTLGAKKTKYFEYQTDHGTFRVFNQGASNLGCAYYLVDVARIEKLIKLSMENKSNGFDLCHPKERRSVVQGFAILITNDHLYWSKHEEGSDASTFSLTDTDYSKTKKEYVKKNRSSDDNASDNKKGTQYPVIDLTNKYQFNWQPYYSSNDGKPEFKYLFLQIPPKANTSQTSEDAR